MKERLLTICTRWRREKVFPELRLSGKWLAKNGFEIGRKVAIKEEHGQLTIRLLPTPEGFMPRYPRVTDNQPEPAFSIFPDTPRFPLYGHVADGRRKYREELH